MNRIVQFQEVAGVIKSTILKTKSSFYRRGTLTREINMALDSIMIETVNGIMQIQSDNFLSYDEKLYEARLLLAKALLRLENLIVLSENL